MKRLLLILLLLPSPCFGQYWGERVAEKSFEQSALYFKSSYLNTYGLHRFGEATLGLVDDPFLELHLNPANLPNLTGDDYLIYVDFRGDRTEQEVIDYYYGAPYYDIGYYPDPRWYSTTREEPEPVLSLGILVRPSGERLKDLFLGSTYQVVYKQEKFYTLPAWIYNYRFGYDAFGDYGIEESDIPVEDRYYGKDELLTEAHLFTVFAGRALSDQADLGISMNRITHSRDGGYINSRSDEYRGTYETDYRYYHQRERNQDYHHYDMSGGVRYCFTPGFRGGFKIGYLSGEADQDYLAVDSTMYQWNTPGVSDRWSYNMRRASSDQIWNRKGHIWYTNAHVSRTFEEGKRVSAYYQYSIGDLDLSNSSTIRDTSYYASRYQYSATRYDYLGLSQTIDDRHGVGSRKQHMHQAMAGLKWELDPRSSICAGLYLSRSKTEVSSSEPVVADRWSSYHREEDDSTTYYRYHRLYEDKRLAWSHRSIYWTIQIPVLLRFRINQYVSMMFGINRILESWDTQGQTIAFFSRRETTDDGDTVVETDFGERYTLPDEKITEDETALISNFEVSVSRQFTIRLLLDPEFEDEFRIAQWWLSFQVTP